MPNRSPEAQGQWLSVSKELQRQPLGPRSPNERARPPADGRCSGANSP